MNIDFEITGRDLAVHLMSLESDHRVEMFELVLINYYYETTR